MSQPFLGEIRIFPYNFAVAGWASCDGQLISIAQNDTLFILIGTTYGGDGVETFALPDLRGREAIHQSSSGEPNYVLGESGGAESVNLTVDDLAPHTHRAAGSTQIGDERGPIGNVWAAATTLNRYGAGLEDISLSSQALGFAGGSQAHDNMPPYLALNFQIALAGVFPQQP